MLATEANSVGNWDEIWKKEGRESWRGTALSPVYDRIVELTPREAYGLDIGGGVGLLSSHLWRERKAHVVVLDHSDVACKLAEEAGCDALPWKLSAAPRLILEGLPQTWMFRTVDGVFSSDKPGPKLPEVVMATEVLEHLEEEARAEILRAVAERKVLAFFSVPNNRLGPDEEPQHTIKWTALGFLQYMRGFFGNRVRVEVLGPFLLAVVTPEPKAFTMSVCFPARDEAADIERTLASFRGVADEMVIGIDPRSTDATREIAERYAEVVFTLEDPAKSEDGSVPEKGVHFAWIRNQCMDRCTGEWIFMTEAHEHLLCGQDALLHLEQVPAHARMVFVLRTGQNQQWGFPWLCRNAPDLRYVRSTHNILDYPVGTFVVRMTQVKTLHARDHQNAVARKEQRKIQNRITLLDDWMRNENEASLHYLGSEWRPYSEAKSLDRFEEFLAHPKSKNGPMRYHTRLLMAKLYAKEDRLQDARRVLLDAVHDDWSRIEHWVYLGDLCYQQEKYEEALQFYRYAATPNGEPPFTLWWVDLLMYRELPAQRLAMTYGALGKLQDALFWAQKARELLPEDAPEEATAEADANIRILEEGLGLHEAPKT